MDAGSSGDQLFRAALDASVDGHSLWAPVLNEGNIEDLECVYTNLCGAVLVGRRVNQIVGSRLLAMVQIAKNPEFAAAVLDVVRTGVPLRVRSRLRRRDGGEIWVDMAAVRLAGGVSISVRDITAEVRLRHDLEEANAELAQLAATDPLTGLANRRAWNGALVGHLERAARYGSELVVALLDLDRFKAFNDTHGHLAGDQLLCDLATRWHAVMPVTGTLARIGGEEFAVALPETDPSTAREFFIKLCTLVPQNETCSAGLTIWDCSEDASSLLGRADAALYAAKHAGRNRVEALLPLR